MWTKGLLLNCNSFKLTGEQREFPLYQVMIRQHHMNLNNVEHVENPSSIREFSGSHDWGCALREIGCRCLRWNISAELVKEFTRCFEMRCRHKPRIDDLLQVILAPPFPFERGRHKTIPSLKKDSRTEQNYASVLLFSTFSVFLSFLLIIWTV